MTASTKQRLIQRFQRITTSGQFIPEIDGLRFLSLIGVLIAHTYNNFLRITPADRFVGYFTPDGLVDTAFSTAGRGVELFFMISGFILAAPFVGHYLHDKKSVNLGRYFLRRLTRLEPPYIIVMVLFFFLRYIPVHSSFAREPGTPDLCYSLLASLGYIHNIVYGHQSYINGVAWSLEVEVQFYLLAPLIAWMLLTKTFRVRVFVYLTMFFAAPTIQHLLEVYCDYSVNESRMSIIGNIQFFLMGFMLAELYAANVYCRLTTASIPLGILLLLGMFLIPVRQSFFGSRILFLGCATGFYWIVLSPGFWQRLFRSTPLVLIGGMCYSVYLLHFPLMLLFSRIMSRFTVGPYFLPNFLLHFVLVALPILICSSIFFLLVEKPCMRSTWPSDLASYLRGFLGRTADSKEV